MSTLYVNTITPNSGDTVSVSGSLFVSGTINLGDANTDSVAFGADISSSIIPNVSSTYDLGSPSKTWDEIYVDGVATKLIISPSGGTITASSNIVPVNGSPSLTLGNTARSWNVLYVNSITASANISASGITTNTITTYALTASAISCSGTIIADAFQSTGNDDTISFEDNLNITGAIVASVVLSSSNADITNDVTVGDDLSLTSDSAVFNMGAGSDFKITHDGTTGAVITGNPILVHSLLSTLSLSGSAAIIDASTGDVSISAGDDIALSAADDISLTSTSEDGLITLHSAHTAGQSILIDANANAGSILDVDAGILDIDIQGAATIDAASITLTGAVTAVNGVQNATVTITATDDGSGTGTIPAGTATVLVNANGDANHIVILPAPIVGNIIHIIENGTTGYELRSTDPTSIAINGGTASSGESAVAGAVTYLKCVCVSSTAWIVSQFDADGDESKLEAAA